MNPQRRKIGRRFLCVLVAAMVSLLLVVLPFAQTLDASDSGRHSGGTGLQDSGAAPDFEYEDADIVVTANLSDHSAIPTDAEFWVEPITQEKDSAAFQDVETQISKDVKADHQTVTGFRAYDIYFSANGTRYEPEAGDVTVTIQYKDRVFDSAVKQATDEIKVLHLKKSGGKTKVENVTKAVDVKNLGGDQAKANSSSEAVSEAEVKDGLHNIDGDSVKFVTKSFSTFVVTGVTRSALSVKMNFYKTDGTTADTSVSGTYYLYVANTSDNNKYYTLKLNVANGAVPSNTQITGLYDQNGQMNGGLLYPMTKGTYTVALFLYSGSSDLSPNFKWNDTNPVNYPGVYTQYKLGSTIADHFTLNGFPDTQNIALPGMLTIGATAQKGLSFSSADILSRLTPVLPYGVFADTYYLKNSEVEGCIAANKAEISGDFGSKGNVSAYLSSANTITVTKTFDGNTPTTFRFGLYKCNSLVPGSVQTLTLPSGNQNTGTIIFNLGCGNPTDYTINELDSKGNIIGQNVTVDGFTLKTRSWGSSSYSSSFNWTSYINSFLGGSGNAKLQNVTQNGYQNILVVGKTVPINKITDNGRFVGYSAGGLVKTSNSQQLIQYPDSTHPMPDFTGVLNNMATLSADLAQAISTDTVVVKNFKASDFSRSVNNRFNTSLADNQWLLINIDATNCSSVVFPSDSQLTVTTPSGTESSGTAFSKVAPRILVNVYTTTQNSSGAITGYAAYTGEIQKAIQVMGTLLAPAATVDSIGGSYNGRIVAKILTSGDSGEIHSSSTGSMGCNWPWTFFNTVVPTSTPFTLPETGGGGTAIFYTTGGAVLLFGAVLAFVYRMNGKRRHIRKRRRNSLSE